MRTAIALLFFTAIGCGTSEDLRENEGLREKVSKLEQRIDDLTLRHARLFETLELANEGRRKNFALLEWLIEREMARIESGEVSAVLGVSTDQIMELLRRRDHDRLRELLDVSPEEIDGLIEKFDDFEAKLHSEEKSARTTRPPQPTA